MKFLCICMAPALDVTIELDRNPTDGAVIKNVRETIVPGGKGLNVARYLAARGAEVSCGGILGREGESYFIAEMKKYGIRNLFSKYDGVIRRNEMIVSPTISYKLNRAAYADLDEFDIEIPEQDCANTAAIISGSLPKNFKPDYYARLIKRMRALGYAKIVLDASGKALFQCVMSNELCAIPDMIKPNAEECAELVGFELKKDADFIKATTILNKTVPFVIISNGDKGAWFNGKFVPAPKVDVRDTTAAGDTLLAEFCFSGNVELAVEAGSRECVITGSEPPLAWLNKLAHH